MEEDFEVGSYCFVIENYSTYQGLGVGAFVKSDQFSVAGYDWHLKLYMNGYDAKSSTVDLVVCLETRKVEVRALFEFCPLDEFDKQCCSPVHVGCTYKEPARACVFRDFIRREEIETFYLTNDTFTVSVTIKVYVVEAELRSGHLENLQALFDSKKGADVILSVEGETFAAHRCVLAAQSPVFMAQLLTMPMKERDLERINVDEVKPRVFEALLRYIYAGSLPWEGAACESQDLLEMVMGLLIAADRYSLEKLKVLCENRLCKQINLDSAAALLIIADRHSCKRLKSKCLQFIMSPPNTLRLVMMTDGFKNLRDNCPSLVLEILENVAIVQTTL